MFGPELVQAFREFKAIWDPDGKMNPGKVVEPYRIEENLRLSTKPKLTAIETHFAFPEDGGDFAQAVERCVGVGKCRRTTGQGEQDTMCPSFMVTREEKHSTRGRTHLLWEMTRGEVLRDAWKSEEVKEACRDCERANVAQVCRQNIWFDVSKAQAANDKANAGHAMAGYVQQ